MRALILGARGAVGREIRRELEAGGHHVTTAGRSREADVQVDLSGTPDLSGLRAAAAEHDVVINASGIENPVLAEIGARAFVDVSATAPYLAELGRRAAPDATTVLGAGLAPGLTTLLVAALDSTPGDEIDLGITLGTGEEHGDAAVLWTAGLVGTRIADAPETEGPEAEAPWNFRESRRLPSGTGHSTHLRADFPDHTLLGRPRGLAIRSYLALTSPLATSALRLASVAPFLKPIITRAPHFGSDAWHLVAVNRRTGETQVATGAGQSRATGILTALAAERAVANPARGAVTMADLTTVEEALRRLDGTAVRPAPQH